MDLLSMILTGKQLSTSKKSIAVEKCNWKHLKGISSALQIWKRSIVSSFIGIFSSYPKGLGLSPSNGKQCMPLQISVPTPEEKGGELTFCQPRIKSISNYEMDLNHDIHECSESPLLLI